VSRLHGSQGDAKDVDEMAYETLVVGTELVGGETSSDGTAFAFALSVETVEANWRTIPMSDYYLTSLGTLERTTSTRRSSFLETTMYLIPLQRFESSINTDIISIRPLGYLAFQ
jgi:hypothetical protein